MKRYFILIILLITSTVFADTIITGGFTGGNFMIEKFRVAVAACDYESTVDIENPPTQGDAAFGETGDTEMHYLNVGKVTRIRKAGSIREIRYAVNTGADGTTGIFLETRRWNFDNLNYDVVATSENICPTGGCLSKAGSYYSHVFSTQPVQQLGDIIGWYETRSGGTTATFRKITTNVVNHSILAKENPTDPDDWTTNLDATYANTIVDFTILMPPPERLFMTDSLGTGIPETDGFCSSLANPSSPADVELDQDVAYFWGQLAGETNYMTSGRGSQTIGAYTTNLFPQEVTDKDAETYTIWLGTNDIINGTALATMKTGMTNLLTGIDETRATIVVLNIIPSDSYDGTQNTKVSDFNTWLETEILNYSGAVLVDANDCVGDGDNISAAYRVASENPNYIHLNPAGYEAIANCIFDTENP